VKHTKLPQGSIKRLSLSVLVDHTVRFEKEKKIVEAPSAEKLKVIKDLVTAAAGIDSNRGDQLVVEAFPFESTLQAEPAKLETAPEAAPQETSLPKWAQKLMGGKNATVVAGIGVGAVLALIVGFVMMLRGKKKSKVSVEQTAAIEAPQKSMTPEELNRQIEAKLANHAAEKERLEAEQLMALKLPVVATKKTEVLTKHIAAETKKDAENLAQVVRTWLNG
jgi:flagellar M-ring protein FliF